MKHFLFFVFLIFPLFSCLSNHKPPIDEEKIISFYTDYYVYTQYSTIISDSLVSISTNEVTDFVLKKNKLTKVDLKNIIAYYEKYPKSFEELLPKIEGKVDAIFKEKKVKK